MWCGPSTPQLPEQVWLVICRSKSVYIDSISTNNLCNLILMKKNLFMRMKPVLHEKRSHKQTEMISLEIFDTVHVSNSVSRSRNLGNNSSYDTIDVFFFAGSCFCLKLIPSLNSSQAMFTEQLCKYNLVLTITCFCWAWSQDYSRRESSSVAMMNC